MTDDKTINRLLNKGTSFAVIGASNNEAKYGFKVYKRLKELGYTVYPINPREELIQGDKAHENLFSLPEKVDVLSFVVPPDIGLKVTKTALGIGYKQFWYQPGSFDKEIIDIHSKLDTVAITDRCILIETF